MTTVAAGQPQQPPVNNAREPNPSVVEQSSGIQPEAGRVESKKKDDPLCEQWLDTVKSMDLIGMTQQLALHAAPESWDAGHLKLVVDISNQAIASEERQKALVKALKSHLGERIRVSIRIDDPTAETPAQRKSRLLAERQKKAEQAIRTDPVVEELVSTFDATIAGSSIQAVNKSQGAEHK